MKDRELPQATQDPNLKGQISDCIRQLPPIQYSRLASSEIDYYGASNNIARTLGLDGIPYSRASWLHAWCHYSSLAFPEVLTDEGATACCKVKEVPNLMGTLQQELFLKKNGYPNAKAVGIPFLYTQEPSVKRIPDSLLIVPEHSIKETNINFERAKDSPFPDTLSNLRSKFSTIVACLGGFCVIKNNYVEIYEKEGVPWVTGAWLHDAYALQRMRNLFSQFEYVATNVIGSHIPYAGYCGCKVSYYGKGIERKREDYHQTPIFQKYPHLIDIEIREQKADRIQELYPFLFSKAKSANEIRDWSEKVLGAKHQIPASEIANLIGWKIRPKDANSWEYIPGENPGLA